MQIKDIMSKKVQYINVRQTIHDAARMMSPGDFGAIPVERGNQLVGMITDRDIALRVLGKKVDPDGLTVEDCMSKGIKYCYEDEEISGASNKMSKNLCRSLPVLSRDKKLVGIVSLGDIALNEDSQTVAHSALKEICLQ